MCIRVYVARVYLYLSVHISPCVSLCFRVYLWLPRVYFRVHFRVYLCGHKPVKIQGFDTTLKKGLLF